MLMGLQPHETMADTSSSSRSHLLMLLIWLCMVVAMAAAALHLHADDAWSSSSSQQEAADAHLPKFMTSYSQLMSSSRRSGGTFDPNGKAIASRLRQGRPRCCSRSAAADLRAAHRISSLPGQPGSVDFDQYGGYVTVDEAKGHALFYYFVEARRHEATTTTKPLVLWLNGGPGCSSLGYGAMQEIGPFRVNSDRKTLSTNKHAWNNVANVIFLEVPVGVGFSYSNTSSDYDSSGDESTVDAAYLFLVEWLELFPEYSGRPFFITGESYAGHYAPQLAATILLLNKHGNNNTIINIQGVMVGNPYLDKVMNEKGRLDYYRSHGLISYEIFENISMKCFSDGTDVASCISVALYAYDMGPINIYNIYAPLCIGTSNGAIGYYYTSGNFQGSYDPCSEKYTTGYLNDPAVQSAFHARRTTNWSLCVDLIWNWKGTPISMVPTIRWLISEGLPVWIYSGDFDSVCPPVATWYSIHELGLHITTPWRPWTVNKKVGGYIQQYMGGFTFASIREAGHDVPSYQPERALVLFKSFLKGELPHYVI